MDENFEFRIVLVKIQDSLTDEDRKKLHFEFGDDIPRRLQANGSLESALEALQVLFDRLKISNNNYEYLVRALRGIERHDCAQRLLDYHRLVPLDIILSSSNEHGLENELPSSASQRPTAAEILNDFEGDTIDIPKTDFTPIKFAPPEPDPMDFNSIDLKPFEDPDCQWTDEYSTSLNVKSHPRDYQIEIIRDAIRSKNTIVCLRTGSGKTLIASLLIKYYFIKKQQANPNEKFFTLFFVPRKAIRLQQAKAISNIGNLKVQICEDDQTIDQLIDSNHVIVTTPQKFVNCLRKGTVHLAQIDLMIFDECHNTSGGNPYCEIMKFYLCPSKKESSGERPLMIGLTATVSSKDAVEKKESIENNLVTLCGKLACRTISTVCDPRNITEINRDISRPKNDQFEFVLKVQYNSYFIEYLKMFEELVKQIKRHLDNHTLLDGQEIGSSGFIGQLVILRQSFEGKGEMKNIIICEYLLLLTKKYSAFKDLPFDMVIKYVLQQIEKYYKGYKQSNPMNNLLYEHCTAQLKTILEKHAENPTTNSKLENLVNLLKQSAREDRKGLILVQTTFYTKTLYDYLHDHPDLINIVKPTWVVGQNSSDHSLTINEQQMKLEQFAGDEYNVLIATDIVQEGLDIPTCSYVIRYEFVSDEIGTIQSRGRARAENSLYYLITELDSINHHREQKNKIREDNMETTIVEWPNIDKAAFHRAVENKSRSLISEWEKNLADEIKHKAALQKIGKKKGSICCRTCSRELGRIEWLQKRNTIYFINYFEFFEKNECQLDSVYKNFQENLIMGDVRCTCGNSLGGCQKFMDRPELGKMCALKCKQIKFKIDDQLPYISFQQWSLNNRFDVDELEEI